MAIFDPVTGTRIGHEARINRIIPTAERGLYISFQEQKQPDGSKRLMLKAGTLPGIYLERSNVEDLIQACHDFLSSEY